MTRSFSLLLILFGLLEISTILGTSPHVAEANPGGSWQGDLEFYCSPYSLSWETPKFVSLYGGNGYGYYHSNTAHSHVSFDIFKGVVNDSSIISGHFQNTNYLSSWTYKDCSSFALGDSGFVLMYPVNAYAGMRSWAESGTGTAPTNSYAISEFTYDSPGPFYAQIHNTDDGGLNLYETASTSASVLKTLPEDWIVKVLTKASDYATSSAYNWYHVSDPTDSVSGWMKTGSATSPLTYLPYEPLKQNEFASTSDTYIATSSRADLILEAVDNYYNSTSTNYSLYSSDDGSNNISALKTGGYPEQLVLGIIAQEIGDYSFNNQRVSYDYGHGIMQLTFNAWYFEPQDPHATYDNRGVASNVTIPPCASLNSDAYLNCYLGAGTKSYNLKPYKSYGGTGSTTYMQYTNTKQSIYANIKDGMQVLEYKYDVFDYINGSTTVGSTTYSADDRKDILATQYYNGASAQGCSYVNAVAGKLDIISTYFSNVSTSSISSLIQKMHTAGSDVICADLHSPGDLSIQDSTGHIVGVVNGIGKNTFPLAVYDKEQKYADVLAATSDDYKYVVTGTASATYGLDITVRKGDKEAVFHARGIPTNPGEIHTYTVDEKSLFAGKDDSVTVQIDTNGDGIPEKKLNTNNQLDPFSFSQAQPIIAEKE